MTGLSGPLGDGELTTTPTTARERAAAVRDADRAGTRVSSTPTSKVGTLSSRAGTTGHEAATAMAARAAGSRIPTADARAVRTVRAGAVTPVAVATRVAPPSRADRRRRAAGAATETPSSPAGRSPRDAAGATRPTRRGPRPVRAAEPPAGTAAAGVVVATLTTSGAATAGIRPAGAATAGEPMMPRAVTVTRFAVGLTVLLAASRRRPDGCRDRSDPRESSSAVRCARSASASRGEAAQAAPAATVPRASQAATADPPTRWQPGSAACPTRTRREQNRAAPGSPADVVPAVPADEARVALAAVARAGLAVRAVLPVAREVSARATGGGTGPGRRPPSWSALRSACSSC